MIEFGKPRAPHGVAKEGGHVPADGNGAAQRANSEEIRSFHWGLLVSRRPPDIPPETPGPFGEQADLPQKYSLTET